MRMVGRVILSREQVRHVATLVQGEAVAPPPEMDALPHLQFFLHINFPPPVSLDALM